MTTIDLANPGIFKHEEWIGKGKKYSGSPQCVIQAATAVKEVLPDVLNLLPHRDMPIARFIEHNLPAQSTGFHAYPTSAWFSNQLPNTISNQEVFRMVMERRNIPSSYLLQRLHDAFGQFWLDGAQSIIDPRYKHGNERLPLYVLSLWSQASTIVKKQTDWKEAYGCLVEEIGKGSGGVANTFPSIKVFLDSRGWDSDITHDGFTFTTHTFVRVLCKRDLCDDVIQCMVHILQKRLRENAASHPHHVIAGSWLHTVVGLPGYRFDSEKALPQSLKMLNEQVKKDPEAVLWIPVLHAKHQVVIHIDFKNRKISYGASPGSLN